jgi:hypothetical protein
MGHISTDEQGFEEGGHVDVCNTISPKFVVRPKTANNNPKRQGLGPLEKFVARFVPHV